MPTEARVLADSINPAGNRLTTFVVKFPRFIHSQVLTHRALSRNAASSRAIPVQRMIARVEADPFIPTTWYANQAGMTAAREMTANDAARANTIWRLALMYATDYARDLADLGVHKSYVNRLLEPFAHVDAIISATEWGNFFALRTAPDAQPEFQLLARLMLAAYRVSTPARLKWGDWHVPYGDRMEGPAFAGLTGDQRRRIAVARCARVSYATYDGDIDPTADLALAQRLADEGHVSPFEHVAKAWPSPYANYTGWRQLRADLSRSVWTWADVPGGDDAPMTGRHDYRQVSDGR